MCCRPGAVPAQLAALRARDPARRDIGGWGRGRRGGAKAALVMIQLARRLLQPLPGIVAGLFGSCRALLPGDWGVCSIRSCFTACRRRVVAQLVQFPRGRRCGGYGWRLGLPQAPPWAMAWGLWVAPRAAPVPSRRSRAARPRPPMPPGPAHPCPQAPPTHAPRAARPAQLSAAFQAFVRNGSQPLYLGALSRQRPLDVWVRHAQGPRQKV